MGRKIRHILPSFLISVVLSGVILVAFKYNFFEGVERRLFDYRLLVRGQMPLSDKVVIAVIDDESVSPNQLGRWPWPRAFQAFLVDALNQYGAKVIGYDEFFPEPDENVPFSGTRNFMRITFEDFGLNKFKSDSPDAQGLFANLDRYYKEILGAAYQQGAQVSTGETKLDKVEEEINPDRRFAKTLARYDNVILGYYFNPPADPAQTARDLRFAHSSLVRNFKLSGLSVPGQLKTDYKNILGLLNQIEHAQNNHVPYSEQLPIVSSFLQNFEKAKKSFLEGPKLPDKKLQAEVENFYNRLEEKTLVPLKYYLEMQLENPSEETKQQIKTQMAWMEGSIVPFVVTPNSVNPFVRAVSLPPNISDFTKNTKHFGHVSVAPDPDGVIRYNLAVESYGNNLFPSLSLEAASLFLNEPISVTLMPPDTPPQMRLGKENIPLDEQGRLLINYRGAKKYPEYNIFYIIRPEVTNAPDPENIAGFFNEVFKKTPEQYFQDLNGRQPKENEIEDMINTEQIDKVPIVRKIIEWESDKLFKSNYGITQKEAFENKVVLVGSTAMGIFDMRVTPFSENYPGVEIHAQVIDSIINKKFLSRPSIGGAYGLGLIIGLALLLGILIPLIPALRGAVVIVGMAIALIGVDYFYFFVGKGWWMPLIYPALQMGGVYFAVTIYRYATEEREKRWIKDTFGRYLAPSVVEELTRNPEMVKLGGEALEMTAFFSDIQGFSTISEKLGDPKLLVELLNDYLSVMAHVIESYEGTVDKYEGDAVIAFWGAPVHFPDHAIKACFACLDQQAKLAELREKWKKEGGWPEIVHNARVRMGLNTGTMVVGNMGSAGRMNYTIMGDAVNLASRLEGANKPYGTYIMISEFTYQHAKDHVEVRELDSLRVVGKTEPVKVYELLSRKGQLPPQMKQIVEVYNRGLAAYKQKDWDTGIAQFTEALKLAPDDGPSKTYLARCEEFKQEPPGQDWDGVHTLSSK